ncbi:MAG: hypothetical protein JSS83_04785 [Cyanobacteria bacterium SZAS LIN-3]|nr:hypothetical protein [Cyanobacteria bacterium SZAS LIN-3]
MAKENKELVVPLTICLAGLIALAATVLPAPAREPLSSIQASSYADVVKLLKSHPSVVYPYTACLELHIRSFKDSTKGKFGAPTATVESEILEVLLDNTQELTGGRGIFHEDPSGGRIFKKRQKFVFRFSTDTNFATAASKSLETLVGKTCILAFDPGAESEDACDVHSIQTPFPEQNYTRADVAGLTAKLRLSSEYLVKFKTALQKYIEARWSDKRIERFCQPDTRTLPFMQSLVPRSSGAPLVGYVYHNGANSLGKLMWYCNLSKDGTVEEYQAEILRGDHNFWVLEISAPSSRQLTDEDIDEHIVWLKLNNSYSAYFSERFHSGDGSKLKKEFWDLRVNTISKFVRNQSGQITGLEAKLDNGQLLTADVSDGLIITNILVDGKPNAYWTEVNADASQNINDACRRSM